jgi:hypothetical protein
MAKKNNGTKIAKHSADPIPSKLPKSNDPLISGGHLSWRFSACDKGGNYCWNIQPHDKFREIIERLHEFETKTWDQIIATGSHPIQKTKIIKDARDRLSDIQMDDIDELMSFRMTGPNRVWCIQAGNLICPSPKK